MRDGGCCEMMAGVVKVVGEVLVVMKATASGSHRLSLMVMLMSLTIVLRHRCCEAARLCS